MNNQAIDLEDENDFDKNFLSENFFDSIESKIIKEMLICPLFPHFLRDPIKCPECEAHFCSKCLKKSLEMNNKCPLCRSEIQLSQAKNEASKIIIGLLDHLKITCEQSPKGCPEKFFYKDKLEYSEHLAEKCLYVDVVCTNYKCNKTCLKKDIEAHMKECEIEQFECEFCQEKLSRNLLKEHIEIKKCSDICRWCNQRYLFLEEPDHPNICDLMWIICLTCQKTLYKKDFQKHKECECVSKPVIILNNPPQTLNSIENTYYVRRGLHEDQIQSTNNNQRINMYRGINSSQSNSGIKREGSVKYILLNNGSNHNIRSPTNYTYVYKY